MKKGPTSLLKHDGDIYVAELIMILIGIHFMEHQKLIQIIQKLNMAMV